MYIKKYLVFFVLVIVGAQQLNAQLNPQFVGLRPFPNGSIGHKVVYDSIGSVQSFVVPTGVTALWVEVNATQGGKLTGSTAGYNTSGLTGRVKAKIIVNPGDSLYIFVGGQPTLDSRFPKPMGGGGKGGTNYANTTNIAFAGGGGGQSIRYYGVKGGGLEGKRGDCYFWLNAIEGGVGGTQTKGGNNGKRFSGDSNVDPGWNLGGWNDDDLTKVPAAGIFLQGG